MRPSSTPSADYLAKVVIIGDSSVGKTNLLLRYINAETYTMSHTATIGVDFKSKMLTIGKDTVKIQFWDTAGQQRYRTIAQTYYNNASGIMVVYSIADRKSFHNVNMWMEQGVNANDEKIPKIIIGQKSDLAGQRVVGTDEGKQLAKQFDCQFIEVSAKENINIEQAFSMLITKIVDKIKAEQLQNGGDNSQPRKNINLQIKNQRADKLIKEKCCSL